MVGRFQKFNHLHFQMGIVSKTVVRKGMGLNQIISYLAEVEYQAIREMVTCTGQVYFRTPLCSVY